VTAVNGAIGVMRKHLKEWLTAAPPEVEHEVEAAVEVAIETPTPARLPTLSVTLFSNAYRWDLWAAVHENRPASDRTRRPSPKNIRRSPRSRDGLSATVAYGGQPLRQQFLGKPGPPFGGQ